MKVDSHGRYAVLPMEYNDVYWITICEKSEFWTQCVQCCRRWTNRRSRGNFTFVKQSLSLIDNENSM